MSNSSTRTFRVFIFVWIVVSISSSVSSCAQRSASPKQRTLFGVKLNGPARVLFDEVERGFGKNIREERLSPADTRLRASQIAQDDTPVVRSRSSTVETVTRISPFEDVPASDVPLDEEFRGTRHLSAARFVLSNPNVIGFVVSQDGGITGLIVEPGSSKKTRNQIYGTSFISPHAAVISRGAEKLRGIPLHSC
jgi:hypothetical protein